MSVGYAPRSQAAKLTITKGKTLRDLLSDNGLAGQLDLVAQYNWGTKVAVEINRALVELVGCESFADDPLDSVLDPARGTGGEILKPEPWTTGELPTEKTHRIKVKKRLPATAAAITKLKALFNPATDDCPVSYCLEGETSRADTKDFEVHATGYYAKVKDTEGTGTITVEKPSGTVTIGNVKETHILRKTEPAARGPVDYTWDGKSEAVVGILTAPAAITSVCAPYFVSVRYYKDATDKTAFIRMEPFYPRWNLTGKGKWDLDEKSLVVKWKVNGEDSSKAKLKHGQIRVYDKDGLVFFAPLTMDQIKDGSYDLVQAPIHWDKTKVEMQKLPYRVQIQAHSDDQEDNGLALAVMPTQIPPYNYEKVQFIGFNIRNDTNTAGTEYLGDDSDEVDIEFRCKAMVEAIQKAKPQVSTDRKVLKVFVAPEFYFRGKKGAYAFENISTIVPRLREETDKYDYLDWLFVFGTALGSHGHKEKTGAGTVYGNAIHLLKIVSIDSTTEVMTKVWSDPKKGWAFATDTQAKTITADPGAKGDPDPLDGGSLLKITLDSTSGLLPTTDKTKAWMVEPVMTIKEAVGGSPTNQIKVANAACGLIAVEPVTNKVITIGGQYWEAESDGQKRKITHAVFFRLDGYYLLTLDSPAPFQTDRPLLLHEPVAVEIFNAALMQKGWHAPHLGDGSLRQIITYKEDFSHIDYIRDQNLNFYDATGKERTIRMNYVNSQAVLPTAGSKDIGGASPNVERVANSAVGSEINKTGLGGGCVIMVDRVTFGMEVCRDHCVHRLFNFYTGSNVRQQDPQVQVHLIPSWGMSIGLCRPGTEVSALRNGLVFNVDGSRMESVARKWDTTYSCDDHISVTSGGPGTCTQPVTLMDSGNLWYRCNTCPPTTAYHLGVPCTTHGATPCNKPLQQMGKALVPSGPTDVPLSNNPIYFHSQGSVRVFPARTFPTADVVTAPATLDSITDGSAKPGFEVEIKLTGTGLAEVRDVRVDGAGVSVTSFSIVSATEVKAKLTVARYAAVGNRNVTVHTFNGPSNPEVFQVDTPAPPTLVSVTPNDGEVAYVHSIELKGTNLQSVYKIEYSSAGVYTYQEKKFTDPQIDLDIHIQGGAAVGPCTITVTSAGGSASIVFTVLPRPLPTVISVTPKTYRQGTSPAGIIVKGTDLVITQSVAVSGGDVNVKSFKVDSDTQLTLALEVGNTAAVANRNLTVTTYSGTSVPYVVTVTPAAPPNPLNINPDELQQGLRTKVRITGTRLLTPSNVAFSGAGVTVHSFQSLSDGEIEVDIELDETALRGTRVVTVTTAGGSGTINFRVRTRLKPSILSIAPPSGTCGTSVQVQIGGRNMLNLKGLNFGAGVAVASYQHIADDLVVATLNIDATATPGIRGVTVANHGGTSSPRGFTVS